MITSPSTSNFSVYILHRPCLLLLPVTRVRIQYDEDERAVVLGSLGSSSIVDLLTFRQPQTRVGVGIKK